VTAPLFALVHSPIVGPDTWEPVAGELRARHLSVAVATVTDEGAEPFWRQHVTSAVQSLERDVPAGSDVIVVVHSGAGQLAAHLSHQLSERGYGPAGFLFVDAGLPTGGSSRLDQLRDEAPEFAAELEGILAAGRPFPDWHDEQLRPLVPDRNRRHRLLAGLRHLPFGYWTEIIPSVPDRDVTPAGVLLLSSGYEITAATARQCGWPVRRLDADNHFHMLNAPADVADELRSLARQLLDEDDRPVL
jgi:hypothetical protein